MEIFNSYQVKINRLKFSKKIPKVSLILVDWSVRESFHILSYLRQQDVSRDLFEVIIIEYYTQKSKALTEYEDMIDTYLVLGMPLSTYHHKHLMYNAGIFYAKGEICVICDSDAMVKASFINSILSKFNTHKNIVLHIDQFRNNRKDLYPFSFPSFDVVLGKGSINNIGGKTRGLVENDDKIHKRNYGACMAARREDLLLIGGADEHIDYLGHICGPYEMTFRLVNYGLNEIWLDNEFMYHTWHPGQDGVDNYMGPHDGKNLSSTAFSLMISHQIKPFVENISIKGLANRVGKSEQEFIIPENLITLWDKTALIENGKWSIGKTKKIEYMGYLITESNGYFTGEPLIIKNLRYKLDEYKLCGTSFKNVKGLIKSKFSYQFLFTLNIFCIIFIVNKIISFLFNKIWKNFETIKKKSKHITC